MSLAIRANCLDGLSREADALAANVDAIRTLSPSFVEQPAALGHLMVPMVQQYLQRSERLGQTPDMELLGPVVAILHDQRTQTEEEPG